MEADVLIQIGLGRFFAGKLRSSVLFSVLGQTEVQQAGLQALDQYKMAREAWSAMAVQAATIYRSDISYGRIPMRRGDWSDRLAAIDKDLEAMKAQIGSAASEAMSTPNTRRAIDEAIGRPARPSIECVHTPLDAFQPGEALALSVSIPQESVEPTLALVLLHYRHVNQGERWKQVEMQGSGEVFTAAVPAEYTQSPYAMQYSFELCTKSGAATMVPAFNATLSNQPYYAVMQRNA